MNNIEYNKPLYASDTKHFHSSSHPMKKRVLSIQSHVVSGYVGNKAAVFPLQLLGYDVDIINSVQFSNHTGYAQGFKGDVLQGDQLTSLLQGMEQNGLLADVGHLLTGYIGSASFLQAVINVITQLRASNYHSKEVVRFVCDPVLGDNGKLYVPKELVEIYRTQVLPLANVVTPNQFEVEQLTGISVYTEVDAKRACRVLLDMGPNLVFITSCVLVEEENKQYAEDDDEKEKTIAILAAQRLTTTGEEEDDEFLRIDSPLYPGSFTGTGDLTASLLLAHTEDGLNIKDAMEKVINTVHAVIRRTHEASTSSSSNTTDNRACYARELKLIASKADIENPPQIFQAVRI
mmetsp:Transcript_8809/g.12775  ORF Transcript_8809/g.12775 Transcript_8809/m.12775 type:complete len:347 (+) Transcript_8809:75-1115(+)